MTSYLRSGRGRTKREQLLDESGKAYWAGRSLDHQQHRHVGWVLSRARRAQMDVLQAARMCRQRGQQVAMATPRWADREAIEKVYSRAQQLSTATGTEFHVDHVVPIKSDVVCGLHVPANLQLLAQPENCAKGNKTWPDMP